MLLPLVGPMITSRPRIIVASLILLLPLVGPMITSALAEWEAAMAALLPLVGPMITREIRRRLHPFSPRCCPS